MKSIIEQLELHEGFRKYPYEDTKGFITIGYGYNLDANGLPKDICKKLLQDKVNELWDKLFNIGWFRVLNEVRKKVILDMAYNMGIDGLSRFRKMIDALKAEDYDEASKEMLDSMWANQVGERAERLAKMMKTGEDYDR